MAACELVIFDCDGTIMDTENIAAEAELDAVREYGFKMDLAEFSRRYAGASGAAFIAAVEEEIGRSLPDDHGQKVDKALNDRLAREAKPMPGVQEMLDTLDQPRCVCSNAGMEKLQIELTKGGLWDRFRPYIFSAQDIEGVSNKPAPDVFLYAAREFDVEPSACVVVEDSIHGVSGVVAAGMRVVGFTGGSHSVQGHTEQLMDAGAETAIDKLTNLPAVIEAFASWDGIPA